jgi:hypothetical protein
MGRERPARLPVATGDEEERAQLRASGIDRDQFVPSFRGCVSGAGHGQFAPPRSGTYGRSMNVPARMTSGGRGFEVD